MCHSIASANGLQVADFGFLGVVRQVRARAVWGVRVTVSEVMRWQCQWMALPHHWRPLWCTRCLQLLDVHLLPLIRATLPQVGGYPCGRGVWALGKGTGPQLPARRLRVPVKGL